MMMRTSDPTKEPQSKCKITLSVKAPPRTTSVSVSPSANISEGSSVTLTCSSDANTPVETYTWYRRTGLVSKLDSKQRYSIGSISPQHSGYYYCEAKNKYGGHNSTEVHLNVLYSPRNMFASINQSGEIVEGSSVTLTCISDANPPVETYTWYRRTGAATVQVGTGASITFTLTSVTAGLYHCKAQNRVGSLISTGFANGDQGEDYDDIQMNSIYQSLNPNTIQPDAVYQMLNPNTTQPSASLNPNTTQPDAVYQSLNPNTTQPDAVYQNLNPNTTQPDAVYQMLNPNTTQAEAV
ncbi:hypothetical protein ACEWY4_017251 [Coilia grayii]|uniref:Ig-like domain-containing protein n=1 Tax=Coilia grayii TaxID=363190 RepID=A0ABD1JGB6_9TELE